MCGKHEFHLGKYLPQVIDEIGDKIDFVILDTVHLFPGEVLDFPVILPYLYDGAIVVLHDITLNQGALPWNDAFATATLLSVVTSKEKFLNSDDDNKTLPFCYPNIAAFKVSRVTHRHIEDAFLSLMLNWHYMPSNTELEIYRAFYKKHYPTHLVDIFDEAIRLNSHRMSLVAKK